MESPRPEAAAHAVPGSVYLSTGTLTVTMHKAEGINGKTWLDHGIANPYAKATYGKQEKKTKSVHHGGPCPRWEEFAKFNVMASESPSTHLIVEIYGRHHIIGDKYLGGIRVDALDLKRECENPKMSKYPVHLEKEEKGYIWLSLAFSPSKSTDPHVGSSEADANRRAKMNMGGAVIDFGAAVLGLGGAIVGLGSNNN